MSTSSLRAELSVQVDAMIEFLVRRLARAAHSGMSQRGEQPSPARVPGYPVERSRWVDRVRLSAPR